MSNPQELISSYLDGTISESDLRALENWIKENPANAREMAHVGVLHQSLNDHFQAFELHSENYNTHGEMVDTMIMPAIRLPDQPGQAEPRPEWSPDIAQPRLHLWNTPTEPARSYWKNFQLRWIAAVAGIALFVLCGISAVMYLAKPNVHPRHARVEAQIDPRWGEHKLAPYLGESIPSRRLFLRSGLVQLRFKGGVSVVLQGPSSFQVSSSHELELFSGKVAARVPHTQIGFSVHTAQAVVTDLGTDFGVQIGHSGATNVVVFKGKVAASSVLPNGKLSNRLARIIHAGYAAKASHTGISLLQASQLRLRFVRSLTDGPLKVNVVDMIAGGNGLGYRTGMGINPATGQVGNLPPQGDRPGNGVYNKITSIPVVSGCFVPGSAKGPMQIDPRGDYFNFPTSVNNVFGNIWAGGKVPWLATPPTLPISTALDGTDYSKFPNDVLVVHSNSGLTLNLDAVRRAFPGMPISSFQAILGDSFVGPDTYDHITRPTADVFVLADGKILYKRIGINGEDTPVHLHLHLPPKTHFLTLVTTDGGDGTADDWILWCDPKLLLNSTRN